MTASLWCKALIHPFRLCYSQFSPNSHKPVICPIPSLGVHLFRCRWFFFWPPLSNPKPHRSPSLPMFHPSISSFPRPQQMPSSNSENDSLDPINHQPFSTCWPTTILILHSFMLSSSLWHSSSKRKTRRKPLGRSGFNFGSIYSFYHYQSHLSQIQSQLDSSMFGSSSNPTQINSTTGSVKVLVQSA